MAGIIVNLVGNAIASPSTPGSASAAINSTTQVTITYGAIKNNGSTLLPLVGSGTNTGDITDSTGSSVSLTYSGTLALAGGTVAVTGSFVSGNTYTFNIRSRNAAGVSSYTTTAGVIPNPTPPIIATPPPIIAIIATPPPIIATPPPIIAIIATPPPIIAIIATPPPIIAHPPPVCIQGDTLVRTAIGYMKARDLYLSLIHI